MKSNNLWNFKLILIKKIIFSLFLSSMVSLLVVFVSELYHDFFISFCIFMTIFVTTLYFTLRKSVYCVDAIINSIDKVFKKDESLIELPSELKNVETMLNTIKYDILRNERIAREAEQRKNDLVVYLAHDLKTPLTSVIGYLTLIHDEKEISPKLREKYLSIALQKSQRLEDLINEFFEITRFNLQNIELEKNKIKLSLMLYQIVDEFYPLFEPKNINCKMDIEENLIIIGDADKLSRVFDNLIRNAINYSYDESTIEIIAKATSNGVIIKVRNKGDEIPEQKLNNIFNKFYRLDNSRTSKTGGSGLGLAIAKEIIELHKGKIEASSNKDFTEFSIFLPQ